MTIKLRPYIPNETPPTAWNGQLKLEMRSGRVDLIAVYPTGEPVSNGNLLMVSSDGLWRRTGITSSLGLPLDDLGRIALDNEPGESARIAELEAEVARLQGSEAPPDNGAWRAMVPDRTMEGSCLAWEPESGVWFSTRWRDVPRGSWVREQPPPPPGGGA